jgi:hypothetical protein
LGDLAAWRLFAEITIMRPTVKIEPIEEEIQGDDSEDEEADEPLYDEDGPPAETGPRFVTEKYLENRFLRTWRGEPSKDEQELRQVFAKVFKLLREEGFFKDITGESLTERMLNAGLDAQQQDKWLAEHDLGTMDGQPTGAYPPRMYHQTGG